MESAKHVAEEIESLKATCEQQLKFFQNMQTETKQIVHRANKAPNDYGAPLVRDCAANLQVLKQIIEAVDVMVVTDKADIDDEYMPKLVKNVPALKQDELIKGHATKNQWFNVAVKKRAGKKRKDGCEK